MTYRHLALVSLLVLCSQFTLADSIRTYWITSISMQMSPSDGSGDNIFFSFSGPNISFTGIGGMGCFDWCTTDPIYGTPSVSPSQVFISNFLDPVIVGGRPTPSFDFGFEGQGLFNNFGGVYPFVTGFAGEGDSFTEFNLILPRNGNWGASFSYIPPSGDQPGYYLFGGALFEASAATPEPGTIGLMLTGLAGIAGLLRKRQLLR